MKLKTITIKEVQWHDLEDAVFKHYGKRLDFINDQECSNDSYHKINVKKKLLSNYEQKRLDDFKAGETPSYITKTLLTDMCNSDVIEQGEYLICVCW